MPSIAVTDGVEVLLNVQPNTLSSIAKYIPGLNGIALQAHALAELLDRPVDQIQDNALIDTGISLQQPVTINAQNLQLAINEQASGNIALIVPREGETETPLLEWDPLDERIAFTPSQCYMAIALNASVGAGLKGSSGKLNFGVDPGASVAFTYYQRFEPTPGQTRFRTLLAESLANFSIPAAIEDLECMPVGSVATVDYSGRLRLSATANLLAAVNPLASLDLPAGAGELSVSAGGKITVCGSFEISGAHQIRVHKRESNEVVLGYYRKKGSRDQFGVTASAGVAATFGDFELFSTLLQRISSDPAADEETLKKAGVSRKRILAIQSAIQTGIDRRLQLSLSDQLSSLRSHEAAFLYRVSLDKLESAGREGLAKALHGDLTELVDESAVLPAGITRMKSVWTETREKKTVFKINLLGIHNLFSIGQLASKGTVVVDEDKGEVTILDQASASRIPGASNNFRLSDEGKRKLNRLLAESFLFTAAYMAGTGSPPQMRVSHSFFKISQDAHRHEMGDWLALARTLNLAVPPGTAELIGSLDEFGPATVDAETKYGPELTPSLFLDSGQHARRMAEYEQIGLEALLALVHKDDGDRFRRIPGEQPALFARMKTIGNVKSGEFRALFPRLNDVQIEAVGVDFVTIEWWAKSMHRLGERLQEMREFLSKNPAADLRKDPAFNKLRRKLSDQMRHVAGDTKEQFGAPWGLVAMYLASGRNAAASVRIANAKLPGALYECESEGHLGAVIAGAVS